MIFKHRVEFQNDTSADGEVDPVYATFLDNVPCKVMAVHGGERYRGQQLQAETTIVIETRYYANLEPKMVAVNKESGEQYLIKHIRKRDGRARYMIIEATEEV